MKEKQELIIYLEWIIEGVNKILKYSDGISFEDFVDNSKLIDATCMQFLHIGETTRKIQKYYGDLDNIPIHKMIGMRNFIAHSYLCIEEYTIYVAITRDVPKLKISLERLINDLKN